MDGFARHVMVRGVATVLLITAISGWLTACGKSSGGSGGGPESGTQAILGVNTSGVVRNTPASCPQAAGNWNAKAARYNPATQKLVFEVYRTDIVGGSIVPAPTNPTTSSQTFALETWVVRKDRSKAVTRLTNFSRCRL